MSEQRPVISSARAIAGCTLTSRVTGLIRDMLLVHTFGATWALDAFFYGFQIPNLFRRLFGEGALAAVFVPVFTRTLELDGRPSAWRLLARTLMQALDGTAPGALGSHEVAAALDADVDPPHDPQHPAGYRRHALAVLARRALASVGSPA